MNDTQDNAPEVLERIASTLDGILALLERQEYEAAEIRRAADRARRVARR